MKKEIVNTTYYDSMAWMDYSYEDYLEWCEEMDEEPAEDESSEFYDWCQRTNELDWDDFKANMKYSAYANVPCMITGALGLWWGRPTINPVKCNSIVEAVEKCIGSCDDAEIKLEDGHIEVLAKHHDGTNVFEIHILSKKGIERSECAERNWEDYNVKPYWFKNIYGYLY